MIRIAFWLAQHSIHHWSNWVAGLYYVRNCLEAIAVLPTEERPSVVAFTPDSLIPALAESGLVSNTSWLTIVPIPQEYCSTPSGLQELTKIVEGYQCDILFPAISPPCIPFKGRIMAWITDYQHKYYPEFFSTQELLYREQMFSFMTAISTKIVCSSESVRSDLYRFFPRAIGRGSILRFAISPPSEATQISASIALDRLGINEPYAYLPYQFWKHKNHVTAFKAWSIMKNQGFSPLLVCSGKTNDSRSPEHFEELCEFLRQHGLVDRIRILGMVSREDQWQLYRGAKFVLQPSLFEGWSTSVEEARSLGKPTVLSDIPVHREQLPDSGYFFDGLNSEELAKSVTRLWNELPDGYDTASESQAIAKNDERLRSFGRALTETFRDVMDSEDRSISSDILPLFLSIQQEASERLKVIEVLQRHINYLEMETEQETSERSEINDSSASERLAQTRLQVEHEESKLIPIQIPVSGEKAGEYQNGKGQLFSFIKRLLARVD